MVLGNHKFLRIPNLFRSGPAVKAVCFSSDFSLTGLNLFPLVLKMNAGEPEEHRWAAGSLSPAWFLPWET